MAITGMLTNDGPIFPHIPPTQKGIGGAGILHPFTLPLPKSVEDGFSAYHESLKKNIKKISRSWEVSTSKLSYVGTSTGNQLIIQSNDVQ